MASTYSPNLRIQLITTGEQANTWGDTNNTNLGTLVEQAISGSVSVDVTAGSVILSKADGESDQSRQMVIIVTGTPGATRTITAPASSKIYIVQNKSNAALNFIALGGAGVAVAIGAKKFVYFDGTNFVEANNAFGGNITISGSNGALRGSYGTGNITTNFAAGDNSLLLNTTGSSNSAVGNSALGANTSGSSNSAVGSSALGVNTTGSSNSAVGSSALGANINGANNSAVGSSALGANTSGSRNVGIGTSALGANTTGSDNTAVGFNTLDVNTTGTSNSAVGSSALGANTTGSSNSAVGFGALLANTTGVSNTAVGTGALKANTTGYSNSVLGAGALDLNTTGYINSAVGYNALSKTTTGFNNSVIGYNALLNNTTGFSNSAIGSGALLANTTGSGITAVGSGALGENTTGSINVGIGENCPQSSPTVSNEVNIFNGSVVARFRGAGSAWSFVSDNRDKTAIEDLTLGLAFITQLRPRKYQWAIRDCEVDTGKEAVGFIAQEVLAVTIANNAKYTGLVDTNNPDQYTLADTKLIPMLVNAIKELKAEIDLLKIRI